MKFDLFFNKELKKAIGNYPKGKEFSNFKTIKNVLILFDKENWKEISTIISLLKKEGKKVSAWSIQPKLSKIELEEATKISYPPNVRFISTNTEINWKNSILPSVIDEFKSETYSACFDFTTENNPHLQYLLALNTANFAVGIRESEDFLYSFVLLKKEEDGLVEAYKQIKHYLEKVEE